MKAILLLLSLVFSASVFAQQISGTVLNELDKPMNRAEIVTPRGNVIGLTDSLGNFSISISNLDRFGIDALGYEITWYRCESIKKKKQIYRVTRKIQEIESVIISRKSSEVALDIHSVNIIDYRPMESYLLTLKREKRNYYVGIDSVGKSIANYFLPLSRPKELFLDCMSNSYILTADSAYQFVLAGNEVQFVEGLSKWQFEKYIKPCKAKYEHGIIMEDWKMLNKQYELILYNRDNEERVVYTLMDSVGYQIAAESSLALTNNLRGEYFADTLNDLVLERRRRLRQIHNGANPDANGMFLNPRPDQQAGVTLSADRAMWMARYGRSNQSSSFWTRAQARDMVYGYPIPISTHRAGDFIFVTEHDNSCVTTLDQNGNFLKKVNFTVNGDIKDIWQDYATGFLYAYTRHQRNHRVYRLDPFTGKTYYMKNFKGMPRTESAIVYDGWLYFKKLDNDFFSIIRVRMPDVFAE